jgi:hypothetical protein
MVAVVAGLALKHWAPRVPDEGFIFLSSSRTFSARKMAS